MKECNLRLINEITKLSTVNYKLSTINYKL
jgi:hypothetical protein